MKFLRKHNLSVFLRMCVKNTRIKADFRHALPCCVAKSKSGCSLVHVVAVLPQGTETFRLIRYPSPLGGFVHVVHGPPIFLPIQRIVARVLRHACLC